MIPYDIDPSLHPAEPAPESLGDGFSPPPHEVVPEKGALQVESPEAALGDKSDF